jgi:hypothetical protein
MTRMVIKNVRLTLDGIKAVNCRYIESFQSDLSLDSVIRGLRTFYSPVVKKCDFQASCVFKCYFSNKGSIFYD